LTKSEPNPKQQNEREYREMTVVLMRERQDVVEVAFSESARFYKLSRQNPKFAEILGRLREARDRKRPVRVLFESPHGDVIEDVV
jgi:hypothetical protein